KNTERYNPATGAWTSAGNSKAQLSDCSGANATFEVGPLTLRAAGAVVAFSGLATGAVAGTSLYHTDTKTWAVGPNLPTIAGKNYDLADAPSVWMRTGRVLFAASPGFAQSPTHFFEFITANNINSITQVADTPNAAFESSFVVNLLAL